VWLAITSPADGLRTAIRLRASFEPYSRIEYPRDDCATVVVIIPEKLNAGSCDQGCTRILMITILDDRITILEKFRVMADRFFTTIMTIIVSFRTRQYWASSAARRVMGPSVKNYISSTT
jgi:hypothetical protein